MAPTMDKRVQVKLEVGHQSLCRENRTPSGFTHDWNIFVRGAEGADISHFIDKCVFFLHESFAKPKRVIKEPPYKVAESGYGSFNLPVEIYFRNKEEPRKHRLEYDLFLQLVGMPPVNHTKVEALTFLNPSEDFERRLLRGGGAILPPPLSPNTPTNGLPPMKIEPPKHPSPASSNGSSPNANKKSSHSYSSHTNKPKVKDTLQHLSQGSKRVADETLMKVKKRKTDKLESGLINPTQKVIREISILSGAEADSLKVKNISGVKKVKEVRERRKSTEVSTLASSNDSPKGFPKEGKHRGKEIKIKKEKEKKIVDKKTSPSEYSTGKEEHPKLQKFTIKRTSDDAWSSVNSLNPTLGHNNNNNIVNMNNNNSTVPSGAVLTNTITTTTKQNERVNALFAEFAEEDSSSDSGDMHIVLPHDDPKVLHKQQTPVENALHLTSSSPPVERLNNNKPKKSKIHKTSVVLNGKVTDSKKETVKKVCLVDGGNKTNGKTMPFAQDLVQMHRRINELQDTDSIQKIVDIVENSGSFDLTPTTFEFDLCILDHGTIELIKQFLDETI